MTAFWETPELTAATETRRKADTPLRTLFYATALAPFESTLLDPGGGLGSRLPDRRWRFTLEKEAEMDTKAIHRGGENHRRNYAIAADCTPHSHSITQT